jgi:membrane-bound metal-dependent hydrolase YbcI (DUF457 family)
MANYTTHRNIGILTTTLATGGIIALGSTLVTYAEKLNFSYNSDISITTIALMVLFGIIGSIFPDIDLKTSRPSKYMRYILMIVLSVFSFFFIQNIKLLNNINEPLIQSHLIEVSIGISVLIPIVIIKLFENIMEHRGLVHSIPFGILASLVIYQAFNMNTYIVVNSLYISILFFVGFITHLFLDEMFSVDLLNAKIKKSFGSALTIFSTKNALGYVIVYALIIGFFII